MRVFHILTWHLWRYLWMMYVHYQDKDLHGRFHAQKCGGHPEWTSKCWTSKCFLYLCNSLVFAPVWNCSLYCGCPWMQCAIHTPVLSTLHYCLDCILKSLVNMNYFWDFFHQKLNNYVCSTFLWTSIDLILWYDQSHMQKSSVVVWDRDIWCDCAKKCHQSTSFFVRNNENSW